jgi:hypothetical protein
MAATHQENVFFMPNFNFFFRSPTQTLWSPRRTQNEVDAQLAGKRKTPN